MDETMLEEVRTKMLNRRNELLDLRDSMLSSRETLQERENELVETAGKEALADNLDRFDQRMVAELRQIDQALASIEVGKYGICDRCGRPIAKNRLYAIPYTRLCKRCAQALETQSAGLIEPEEDQDEDMDEEMDTLVEELTDDQMTETIWDALDTKEELRLDGLEIRCLNRVVHLTGRIADEQEHQRVLEIIAEDLGFEDIIDRLDIEELERRRSEDDTQVLMEGEHALDDPYRAIDENEPMVPPDAMAPEDDR